MNEMLLCLLIAIVIVYLSNLFMTKYEGMSSKRRARKEARAKKKDDRKEHRSEKKEAKAEKKEAKKEAKSEKKEEKKEHRAEKKEGRKEHRAEKKEGRKEHRAEKKEHRAEKKEERKEHRAEKKEGREEHRGKILHAGSDEEEMINDQISKDIADIAFSNSDKNNLADVVNEFKNKKIKNANKDTILKYIRSIRLLKLRINNEILFKTKFTDVFNFSDDDVADQDIVSVLTNVDSTIQKKTSVINQLNILEDSLIDHYNYLQKLVN